MEKSRVWTLVVIAFVIAGSVVLALNRQAHRAKEPDVRAIASFYPVAEFTRQVGGSRVAVTTLVQPGSEPHDYEPTARVVASMYRSDMFVFNGAGMEPWIKKLQSDLNASQIMQVDTSTGIRTRSEVVGGSKFTDPHIWLDPKFAMRQVDNVRKGLIAVNPEHAYDYVGRADAYTAKLQKLDAAFAAGLAHCTTTTVISSHESLGYLAARYGLNAVGIAGLSPDEEPSPQRLAEIADLARANHVQYILYETGESSKLADTVAAEIGAQSLSFNTMESPSAAQLKHGGYIDIQMQNLHTLQTALGCTP
jgi:zinc transport system substrate-binding protein